MHSPSLRRTRLVQGTQRSKIWRAIQIKGKFCLSDLCRCVLTGTETAQNPRNSVGRYVAGLAKVRIVIELPRRKAPASPTSNGEKRWLLVRDVGRKAPVLRPNGDVYDPNSDSIIPLPVIEMEAGHDQ